MDDETLTGQMEGQNELVKFVRKIIKQELKNPKNLPPLYVPGKIASVNGNKANVYINGSTTATTNVPYIAGLNLIPNDEVWVVYINFNSVDPLIWCKRIIG